VSVVLWMQSFNMCDFDSKLLPEIPIKNIPSWITDYTIPLTRCTVSINGKVMLFDFIEVIIV